MRRVGGRFVLEEPLGQGGMGTLFRARDERTGGAVAVKILKRSALEDPVLRERFRREARALSALRHPSIVGVVDFGEADGDLYTALELVGGETLERAIADAGAMPLARAAAIATRILDALEVCHAAGVVHRDVKPSNVMIGAGDAVTLIDFGLARVASAPGETLTETGTVQGTPSYMAPEQCRGEEVGPACDVYATGAVLYEMLAGAPPFRAPDAATIMAQHLFAPPPPLRDAPSGIAAAVESALAKQAKDRPTAHALRDAIARALAGDDPGARAAAARRESYGLARDARAIGASGAPAAPARGRVVVWIARSERAAAIAGCLGAAGLACSAGDDDAALDGGGVAVVSARDGMDRVRAAAARAAVVVVDVGGPDETTAAIRAGARDMLLAGAPDADLAPKIERLLRRARR